MTRRQLRRRHPAEFTGPGLGQRQTLRHPYPPGPFQAGDPGHEGEFPDRASPVQLRQGSGLPPTSGLTSNQD